MLADREMKKSEPKLGEKIDVKESTVNYYKRLLDEISTTYKNFLDEKTSIQILQSHGRFKECLDFAEKLGKYEEIILNYINEKAYSKAVERIINYIENLSVMRNKATPEDKKNRDQQIVSLLDFILKHSKELILNDESKRPMSRRLSANSVRDAPKRSVQLHRQQQEDQDSELLDGAARQQGSCRSEELPRRT